VTDLEIGFVKVRGMRLRYALRRGVGPPLLICNGIGANLELLFPLVRALPDVPLVLFDVPGTGESPPALFWPMRERYVRLAVGVLDELGFEGEFVAAGVSWGGALAQEIARRVRERTRGLILMATGPGIFMVPGRFTALLPMATPLRYLSREYMVRHAPAIYGGEVRRDPKAAREFARHTRPPAMLAYLQQLAAMSHFSSLHWLRALRCPALVLAGAEDPLVRPINARILAALLRDARLEIIEGGGHLFPVLQPEATARAILAFLERSGTAGER
jgi:poly(3-hydroxyoctanoate) depolymerase